VRKTSKNYKRLNDNERLELYSAFLGLFEEQGLVDGARAGASGVKFYANHGKMYLRRPDVAVKLDRKRPDRDLGFLAYRVEKEKTRPPEPELVEAEALIRNLMEKADAGKRDKDIKVRQAAKRIEAVLKKFRCRDDGANVSCSVSTKRLIKELESDLNAGAVKVLFKFDWLDEVKRTFCDLRSASDDKGWRKKVSAVIDLLGTSFVFADVLQTVAGLVGVSCVAAGAGRGQMILALVRGLVEVAERFFK